MCDALQVRCVRRARSDYRLGQLRRSLISASVRGVGSIPPSAVRTNSVTQFLTQPRQPDADRRLALPQRFGRARDAAGGVELVEQA